jgi:hypothetical protein
MKPLMKLMTKIEKEISAYACVDPKMGALEKVEFWH